MCRCERPRFTNGPWPKTCVSTSRLPSSLHPKPPVWLHTRSQKHWFIPTHFPILCKPKNVCACQESFVKTLAKSTCKWFVYLRNRNKLLSLVISLFQNRESVLACEQTYKAPIHTRGNILRSLPPSLRSFSAYWLDSHVFRTRSETFFHITTSFLTANSNWDYSSATEKVSSHHSSVSGLYHLICPELAPNHCKCHLLDSVSIIQQAPYILSMILCTESWLKSLLKTQNKLYVST